MTITTLTYKNKKIKPHIEYLKHPRIKINHTPQDLIQKADYFQKHSLATNLQLSPIHHVIPIQQKPTQQPAKNTIGSGTTDLKQNKVLHQIKSDWKEIIHKNTRLGFAHLGFAHLGFAHLGFAHRTVKTSSEKFGKTATLFNRRPTRSGSPNHFCLITIKRTKNNTHATISNLIGDIKTKCHISAGQLKLPGGRRKTRLSQRLIYKSCLEKAKSFGYKYAVIHCKGTRGSKVRIFRDFGNSLTVLLIKDATGAAHNGCRPRKVRRV